MAQISLGQRISNARQRVVLLEQRLMPNTPPPPQEPPGGSLELQIENLEKRVTRLEQLGPPMPSDNEQRVTSLEARIDALERISS